MNNPEDKQLNQPTRNYFRRKLKCVFARTEFSFFAGKLDVLAYDQKNRCFHISEGKRSSNVASVGHAIGQLIAYMSMIQERGYDFLNQISREEKLNLSDFSSFLENKKIKVCFYVTLPRKDKEKLLQPVNLMLKNLGEFGSSIGIFFADIQNCESFISPKPILIKIRKIYKNREDFLEEIKNKFLESNNSADLDYLKTEWKNIIQFKKKDGNPFLHFEIHLPKQKKSENHRLIIIAFDLEFAKSHLKYSRTQDRFHKIQKTMKDAYRSLSGYDKDFIFQRRWGKNWCRLSSIYKTSERQFNQDDANEVLVRLILLVSIIKPKLDKINWGRIRENKNK